MEGWLAIGVLLGLIYGYMVCYKVHHLWLKRILLWISLSCLSCAYALSVQPPPLQRPWAPPREIECTVEFTHIYHQPTAEKPYVSGLGVIQNTSFFLDYFVDQPCFISVHVDELGPHFLPGTIGKARALLMVIEPKDGFRRYLKQLGIHYEFRRGEWLNTVYVPNGLDFYLHQINLWMTQQLSRAPIDPTACSIYVSMLLGNLQKLGPDDKQAFARTGTMHLFAISGLHIAVISGLLFFICQLVGLPRLMSVILMIILIGLYVEATGGSPSARRAWMMLVGVWLGFALKRQNHAWGGLVLSAIIHLCWRPSILFHTGFQLSYAVVAGLLLYGLPLSKRLWSLCAIGQYIPVDELTWFKSKMIALYQGFIQSIALSWAATIFSLPIVCCAFGLLPWIGFLMNIVLIPIASVVMVLGIGSLFSCMVYLNVLGIVCNQIAQFILLAMLFLIHTVSDISWCCLTFPTACPALGGLITLSLIAFFTYSRVWVQRLFFPFVRFKG